MTMRSTFLRIQNRSYWIFYQYAFAGSDIVVGRDITTFGRRVFNVQLERHASSLISLLSLNLKWRKGKPFSLLDSPPRPKLT